MLLLRSLCLLLCAGAALRAQAPVSLFPMLSCEGGDDFRLADFNGAGRLDLLVTRYYQDELAVNLALADGTFGPAALFAVAEFPGPTAIGDFDADGDLDVAVASNLLPLLTVLLGDGTGGFGSITVDPLAEN